MRPGAAQARRRGDGVGASKKKRPPKHAARRPSRRVRQHSALWTNGGTLILPRFRRDAGRAFDPLHEGISCLAPHSPLRGFFLRPGGRNAACACGRMHGGPSVNARRPRLEEHPQGASRRASVPIPKFVQLCSDLIYEFRNRRTLANL